MTTRVGLKWNYFEPDVIAAWVAEMDFGLAPSIASALHAAVDRGDTGYFYPGAELAVAEAGSRFWSNRFGWTVEPSTVFHVPDVVEGLRRSVVHLTRPGSAVILSTPAYFPFFSMVDRAGRDAVIVRSKPGDDGLWRLDMEGIERAFADGAGSIVLCNPWNPVGRSLSAEEVAAVVATAERYDARVIADEVHSPLTYAEGAHVVAAALSPETVVTVTAASKAWNIPGLKAAQVILTNESDRDSWSSYFTPEKVGVSTFGLFASAAAYREGQAWLDEVMVTLDRNRRVLSDVVAEMLPEARLSPNQATYLAWLDLSAYGWDLPGQVILEHARVAVSEGSLFGPGGEGHVRVNFAMDEGLVLELVERIAAIPRA